MGSIYGEYSVGMEEIPGIGDSPGHSILMGPNARSHVQMSQSKNESILPIDGQRAYEWTTRTYGGQEIRVCRMASRLGR